MTAQHSDSVNFQSDEYSICGVNGTGLLTPEHFGQTPVMMSTACYRGYVSYYLVDGSNLFLNGLLYRNQSGVYPEINGVVATRKNIYKAGEYDNIRERCHFTGGLLIGKGFIRNLYVHMGFHPAWKFEQVYELIFKNGSLEKERNCSDLMQEFREEMVDAKKEPELADGRKKIESWIEQAFSLDYNI